MLLEREGLNLLFTDDTTHASAITPLNALDPQNLSRSNWLPSLTSEELIEMQKSDSSIGPIYDLLEQNNERPDRSKVKELDNESRLLWS
ncbi:hypothetical protein SNE40_011111 [Patella caerulea]|uniref:Uncharacterized protein n=1 Tax=Patella caerulea TaxID=87958 RepID=A0AAN8JVG9_PATCE